MGEGLKRAFAATLASRAEGKEERPFSETNWKGVNVNDLSKEQLKEMLIYLINNVPFFNYRVFDDAPTPHRNPTHE